MDKPGLLLLHGALGSREQFRELEKLLQPQFSIHSFDFEGHGSAPPRDRPFRIEHFAENIAEYLDRGGIEAADIFGYSMGGYAALCLALTNPGRINRIATFGTKFRWDPGVAQKESSHLDPKTISEKIPRYAETLKRRHSASGWENVLRLTADMMLELGQRPVLTPERYRIVQQPVRIGLGDRDSMVSVEESVEVYRALPRGEMVMFPNTPHPLEKVPLQPLSQSLIEFFT